MRAGPDEHADEAVRIALAALAIAGASLLAGCGGGGTDSGGMTVADRNAAQLAFNALQGSNIPLQMVNITSTTLRAPKTCRVHLKTRSPRTFSVYVFWIPFLGTQSYTWMNMTIGEDVSRDTFHLGTEPVALPGGVLTQNGRNVAAGSADYSTPLAYYGPAQARKNQATIRAHAAGAFAKPGAPCQVLKNGYLRLLPNP